jgi:guanylate kinase
MIELATSNLGFQTLAPYTTRDPRTGEIPGRDYQYVSHSIFHDMIKNGDLLDWDYTLKNYYGCPMSAVGLAESEEPAIIHALARMAVRISHRLAGVLLVFLNSYNETILSQRIGMRGYGATEYLLRTEHWHEEKAHSPMFDMVIENAELLSDLETIEILCNARDRLAQR